MRDREGNRTPQTSKASTMPSHPDCSRCNECRPESFGTTVSPVLTPPMPSFKGRVSQVGRTLAPVGPEGFEPPLPDCSGPCPCGGVFANPSAGVSTTYPDSAVRVKRQALVVAPLHHPA